MWMSFLVHVAFSSIRVARTATEEAVWTQQCLGDGWWLLTGEEVVTYDCCCCVEVCVVRDDDENGEFQKECPIAEIHRELG